MFANQDAVPHLRRALTLATVPLVQAEIRYLLGFVYHQWGKFDAALEELNQGLDLCGQDPSLTRARLLVKRCAVLVNQRNLDDAEQDGAPDPGVPADIVPKQP